MPIQKICSYCHELLDADQFHRNGVMGDGLDHRCKPCFAAARRKLRALNPERFKAFDAAKDMDKHYARSRAKEAVKQGKIQREPCFICGAQAEIHHPAYSAPLLVTWLCRSHHRQLHAEHQATHPTRFKPILAVNITTGERKILPTPTAWKSIGFLAQGICRACRGIRKSYLGWSFSFLDASA